MIDSAIFTACHVRVLALHPNQTRRAELAAYKKEDVIPHTESSTAWRAANSARFPVLAVEAKRYLRAPLTSVASECFFGSAAQVYYRQTLSSCVQTSLTTPLTMLLLRQDVKTSHERLASP